MEKQTYTQDDPLFWMDVLDYHVLDEDQLKSVSNVRMDIKRVVTTILANVPKCADRTAALRKIREAMMTCNAAISLKGTV